MGNCGLNTVNYQDYEELLNGPMGRYYAGRWHYMKEVIAIIQTVDAATVVELGPGLLPIVKGSDVMINPEEDQFGRPMQTSGNVIVHDATIRPWPVRDKQYDLFIALQVWEHLDNKQSRAFREVMRIAKYAVLSFPYQWEGGEEKPSHRAHRFIDRELIGDWTLHVQPERVVEIPRTGAEFSKGPRIIYYWKF